jgi:glycosyltransferase involved in cell wall biosynthesis
MKLLIVTQKVDRTDPILGFFHRWVAEFARQSKNVSVIGQLVGEHEFDKNVTVESLGKEQGKARIVQVLHFWKLQWRLRNQYDAVLVHMTPIWIVLGAPMWILLHKRMYLWYEARGTRWPLRIALRFVRKVFSASVHGMPLRTEKSIVVGHGIDPNFFASGGEREEHLLLTVGRITASKNLDVILQAFEQLPKEYRLMIVGRAITGEDKKLLAYLQEQIEQKKLRSRVSIQSATQDVLQPLLQRATAFVHASDTSLDKAVLEAMSSECPVISTAEAVQALLLPVCQATRQTLGARIKDVCELSVQKRGEIAAEQRAIIERDHSLSRLIKRLLKEMLS